VERRGAVSFLFNDGLSRDGRDLRGRSQSRRAAHHGVALLGGAVLAKQKRYTAHGICQSTVLLLNLLMIGLVMWPSFQQQVKPALSQVLRKRYYEVATTHAVLGIAAKLLGLYVVLVAGTNVVPQWRRFKNWKWWMQAGLVLWAIALVSGVGTYCVWYVAPFRKH
jgi:uncharacterized membrane protein YozB (DUF420 family)